MSRAQKVVSALTLLLGIACGPSGAPKARVARPHPGPIAAVAPSPPPPQVAMRVVASDEGDPTIGFHSMRWLDDHRLLLSGTDVRVFDVATQELTVLHSQSYGLAALSADRSRIVVTGVDGAEAWSVSPLTRLGKLACEDATFGPKGVRLACKRADDWVTFDLAENPAAPRVIERLILDSEERPLPETMRLLAKRLASAARVQIVGDVLWNLDTGDAIVAVEGQLLVGGQGRFVMARPGGSEFVFVRAGDAGSARTLGCRGSIDVTIDPDLPRAYGTEGVGQVCVIDLATGKSSPHGTPPPPRKQDCCGSPHISALGHGLALVDYGFVWSTLVDANAGAALSLAGYGQLSLIAEEKVGSLIVAASDMNSGELVAFDPRTRRLAWRRAVNVGASGSAPLLASDAAGAKVALLRAYGDVTPLVIEVATGRVLSPPDTVDVATLAENGALTIRVASGAMQRLDLVTGALTDVTTLPRGSESPAAAARGHERCDAMGMNFLASREDLTLTACMNRGRVALLRESGTSIVEVSPRPSLHGAIVYADDGSVDSVSSDGSERATSTLSCLRGDQRLPFGACEPMLRKRGLLVLRLKAPD